VTLSPQWLDELRARISLSAVIGRTTRLTKAGGEYKACCPFHNEKTPSFTVSDQKGFYHCFGCGAHGDAIRWMTDQRGLAFMDAVKELAAEAGMEVPAPDPRTAKAAEQRDTLHDVMAAAQAWFAAKLAAPEGEMARAYLATRGFDAHTVERFGFGYAPDGRQALKAALARFPENLLIEAGLRIAVDDREPYDRFRGRLMLPIEDARGRVIGFGGRILDTDKTDAPKYLNSPDTPLFDKGRTLYNLHRAGPLARRSGRLVVVEGYMDVIALAAAGIGECVAPLGTALTERQIELLWRVADVPVLCFDGDAAGQRAAMRAISRALPLLRPAHSLKIARLPSGLDPDDLVSRDGPAAMTTLLDRAQSLVETLWENERDAAPLVTPEDKAGLKARLLAHVETIADPDIRALYRRELLERYSAWAFPPRQQLPPRQQNQRHGGRGPQPAPQSSPDSLRRLRKAAGGGARDGLEIAVLAGLIRHPGEIGRHADSLARLSDADPRIEVLLDAHEAGEPLETHTIGAIFARRGQSLPAPEEYAALRFGFLEPAPESVAVNELAQAVSLLVERPALEAALAAATARFERELSEGAYSEQQRLLQRKLEFDARLRHMASARAAAPTTGSPNNTAE
jgi:DNA primase